MGSRDACKEIYEMVREYEIYIYIYIQLELQKVEGENVTGTVFKERMPGNFQN